MYTPAKRGLVSYPRRRVRPVSAASNDVELAHTRRYLERLHRAGVIERFMVRKSALSVALVGTTPPPALLPHPASIPAATQQLSAQRTKREVLIVCLLEPERIDGLRRSAQRPDNPKAARATQDRSNAACSASRTLLRNRKNVLTDGAAQHLVTQRSRTRTKGNTRLR